MEIGQMIKWELDSVSKITCVGVYLQQISDEISEVMCHYMNDKKYAIKIYQKVKLNDSMKRKAVQREIMALKRIDHPHIIKMYDLIETGK